MTHLPISVIVPTYNNLPVLKQCLNALLVQKLSPFEYEIIVINDGSNDGSIEYLTDLQQDHFNLNCHHFSQNQGRVDARNQGIKMSRGELLVFVDSDIIVIEEFLKAHLETHQQSHQAIICQGPVILTQDLAHPTTTQWHPLTDFSRAFFATGNVSIKKEHLLKAGLFDPQFKEYGWEDLELGVRLKKIGIVLKHHPQARGFHFEKELHLEDLANLIEKEKARARGAWLFFLKHPTLEVRLMTQLTPFHRLLDRVLTQHLSIEHWLPGLKWLRKKRLDNLSIALMRGMLNHYYIQELNEKLNNHRQKSS